MGKLNIILFGVDRCPRICRPALENFLLQLGGNLDIYIGIVSLENDKHLLRSEELELEQWISFVRSKMPSWHVKVCQIFRQTDPSLYGPSSLLTDSLNHCKAKLDIFNNGYASISNYMNYLYFSRCFSIGLAHLVEDHLTLLLRPDMQYGELVREDLNYLEKSIALGQCVAYVMAHDSFGYVNDRFIGANVNTVLAYMQRINCLKAYLGMPWRYFHSEQFASWFLHRHMKLSLVELPLSFWGKRVRSNGRILDDSNPSTYDADKQRFRQMFRRHTYWQMKLSVKSWLDSL